MKTLKEMFPGAIQVEQPVTKATINGLMARNDIQLVHFTGHGDYQANSDLNALRLEDGRTVDILKHFAPKLAEAKTPQGAFLRDLSRRAYDEEVFSSVLTPFFNAQQGAERAPTVNFNFGSPAPAASPAATAAATP